MTVDWGFCDVLVIGGGPSGSTAAALLAGAGRDVVLVEKDAHPRFHIGESLLPQNFAVLKRLGIGGAVETIGLHKPGAEFVDDLTDRRVAFDFSHSLVPNAGEAYQVRRAEFDGLVFAAARDRGARTVEQTRVTAVEGADGERLAVRATGPAGEERLFRPRFVLDASGRDTFMANRTVGRDSNKQTNTAAVFAHYRGIERREGDRAGYISVHLVDDGWFWMIPLRDGTMSVGFVGMPAAFRERAASMDEFLAERVRRSRTVSARMARAERVGPVRSTGNYSYRARRSFGDRWMMIGDAFGFIDPVFSSGVLLAMTTGERGAAVADAWLDDPRRGRALARRNEREVRAAMDRFGWMIYRINTPVLRELFMAPANHFRMQDAVISLLCGHIWGDRRMTMPVAAFKLLYHALGVVRRVRPRRHPHGADLAMASASAHAAALG